MSPAHLSPRLPMLPVQDHRVRPRTAARRNRTPRTHGFYFWQLIPGETCSSSLRNYVAVPIYYGRERNLFNSKLEPAAKNQCQKSRERAGSCRKAPAKLTLLAGPLSRFRGVLVWLGLWPPGTQASHGQHALVDPAGKFYSAKVICRLRTNENPIPDAPAQQHISGVSLDMHTRTRTSTHPPTHLHAHLHTRTHTSGLCIHY